MERYRNTIEFEVYGKYAFFDPVTRGGEDKLPYSDGRSVVEW